MLEYLCIDFILEASMEGLDRGQRLLIIASFIMVIRGSPLLVWVGVSVEVWFSWWRLLPEEI